MAAHDCLTPVVVLPSGAEIAGAEVCLADDVADTGLAPKESGCATGAGAGSWGLAALAGLAVRGRRRRR